MSVIQQLSTPFLSPTVAVGNVGCVPREAGRANMDSKNQIFQKFGVVHFVWSGSSLREQSSKLPFVSRPALASAASLPASSRRLKEIYKLWVFTSRHLEKSLSDQRLTEDTMEQTIHKPYTTRNTDFAGGGGNSIEKSLYKIDSCIP